jgi:toxin ParE1/3/4
MTFKIIISEQANMDLRAIYEYIAYNLHSPETASKQLN